VFGVFRHLFGAFRHLFGRLRRRRQLPPITGTVAAVEDIANFPGEVAFPPAEGALAAVEGSDLANFAGKRDRRMPARDPAKLVAREIWPPDGEPPPTMPTEHAIRELAGKMKDRKIPVPHNDTLRTAINRRAGR